MKNKVGGLIRKARGSESLRNFADQCGVSHTIIDTYEKGFDSRTKKPIRHTVDTLTKIATGAKISLNDLINASVDDLAEFENNEEVNVEPNYILAAHRKGGIAELPEEAQKELDNYVEYLRAKYKK